MLSPRNCVRNFLISGEYRCRIVTLPPVRPAVADGRAWCRETMKEWQLDDMTDVVQQLVSELVTNSVQHARTSEVRVLLLHAASTLRLDVTDDDVAGLPVMANASVDDISGRGLAIVDALSDRWGVHVTATAKTVWTELTHPEPAPRGVAGGRPPRPARRADPQAPPSRARRCR